LKDGEKSERLGFYLRDKKCNCKEKEEKYSSHFSSLPCSFSKRRNRRRKRIRIEKKKRKKEKGFTRDYHEKRKKRRKRKEKLKRKEKEILKSTLLITVLALWF